MELSPSHTAPTVWGATVRKESHWKTKKSARVGLWKRRKAEKSKKRLSLLAWKSRKHRGIPTFPQPRLRLVINLNRTFHLLRKPDILICYQHTIVKPRAVRARAPIGRSQPVSNRLRGLPPPSIARFACTVQIPNGCNRIIRGRPFWSRLSSFV